MKYLALSTYLTSMVISIPITLSTNNILLIEKNPTIKQLTNNVTLNTNSHPTYTKGAASR